MSYIEIKNILKSKADKKRAEKEKSYLKTSLKLYGCGVPATREASKSGTDKDIKKLWQSDYFEEKAIAIFLVDPDIRNWNLLKSFFKNIDNWALSDWACEKLSTILKENPKKVDEMIRWTSSRYSWLRRAAAVIPAIGIRKKTDIPSSKHIEIADRLMMDKDYFVQMGAGWLLRDIISIKKGKVGSVEDKKNKKIVLDHLRKYKGKASQVIIRRAVERLSKEERKEFIGRSKKD